MQQSHVGKSDAVKLTILQQPVVLKALAKLIFDLEYGVPKIRSVKDAKAVYEALERKLIDFSHSYPLWSSLFKTTEERNREFPKLSEYVFVDPSIDVNFGNVHGPSPKYLNPVCFFGSRHNDIYPRIGDLIRFELNLKPRPTVTAAIKRFEDKNEN